MNTKKSIALSEIFLIISLTVAFSVLQSEPVQAAPVCCQQTTSGEFCQYVDSNECAPDSPSAPTSCAATNFCKPGTCIDTQGGGNCYANVPKAACEQTFKGEYTTQSISQVPACSLGCCVLGTQAFLSTEASCKVEVAQHTDLTLDFRRDITTQQACTDVARSEEKGCCVQGQDLCTYGAKSTCTTPRTDSTGFFSGVTCSQIGTSTNNQISCGCVSRKGDPKSTMCVPYDDAVHWKDSCGNDEGPVTENVLPVPGTTQKQNGLCDYAKGTLCGDSDKDGISTCEILDCKSIPGDKLSIDLENAHATQAALAKKGGTIRNGEKFCLFDSAEQDVNNNVVGTRSPVGSGYFTSTCINGQEIIEPCSDLRNEFCIAGTATNTVLNEPINSAACVPNRGLSCIDDCNLANPSQITEDGDDALYKENLQKDLQCCSDTTQRDCSWIGDDTGGKCIPKVGLGFQGDDGAPTCEKALMQCPVVLVCPGTSNLLGACDTSTSWGAWIASGVKILVGGALAAGLVAVTGGAALGPVLLAAATITAKEIAKSDSVRGGEERGWHVVAGRECLSNEFLQAANNMCRSFGDCGANINYDRKLSTAGFISTPNLPKEFQAGGISDTPTFPEEKQITLDANNYKDPEKIDSNPGTLGTPDWNKGSAFYNFNFPESTSFGDYFAQNWFGSTIPFLTFTIGGAFAGYSVGGLGLAGATASAGPLGELIAWSFSFFDKGKAFATSVEAAQGSISTVTTGTEIGAGVGTEGAGFLSSANIAHSASIAAWVDLTYEVIDYAASNEQVQSIRAACTPWVPPTVLKDNSNKDNSNQCERCNPDFKDYLDSEGNPKDIRALLPCTEYRCKSLGLTCELVNAGTTDERCIDMGDQYNTNPPTIQIWKEGFDKNYRDSIKPTPIGNGVIIDKEIPVYEKVLLAFTTDQPAQCKMSFKNSVPYDQMGNFFFDTPTYKTKHIQPIFWPAQTTASEGKLVLADGGGTYNLYVRCENPRKLETKSDYVFQFTVGNEPDRTAPQIITTSLGTEAYLTSGQNKTDVTLKLNEPAQCKWSLTPQAYKDMTNTCTIPLGTKPDSLGEFSCVFSGAGTPPLGPAVQIPATKAGTNSFVYFKCQDYATDQNKNPAPNTMVEPFKLTLHGSDPLEITSVTPSGDIYTSLAIENVTLKVTTAAGAKLDGSAICKYTQRESTKNTYQNMEGIFLTTDSSSHEQPLILPTGDQTFYVGCADAAGNLAYAQTTFHVLADVNPPQIIKTYKTDQPRLLNVIVNEDAQCVFSTTKQNFAYDEGSVMIKDGNVHSTTDDANRYYVRCKDNYQNTNTAPLTITFL